MTQPVVREVNLIKHPLTYLRIQRGWSQQDLVDVIATSARKLGVPLADGCRKKAWRWENRGVTPEADAQRALAHVLDIPYERVQMLPWPRWLPVGEAVPSDYPWTIFDIGHHSAAQRYYLGALHAAHQADDRAQGANVLAGLSFQQALYGEPRDGVALADTAQEHARTAPPRVRALIASRQARAHARAHDAGACNRALLQAEHMLQRAETSSGDDPAWVYYFGRAELEAQAGACFIDLRQPRTADELLTTALADHDPSYVRDRAMYLVRSAATQLQFGQLDYACALAGQAAQLARKTYSGRSIASVKAFRASLEPNSSSPHVAALDTELAGLAA
jgi:transcriptional regulator with XRE-family HTH domain